MRIFRFALCIALSLATACSARLASQGDAASTHEGGSDSDSGSGTGGGGDPAGCGGNTDSSSATGAIGSTIQAMRIAVDATSLYWIDVQIHAHRMPKSGGTNTIIDGTSEIDEIAPGNCGLYYLTSSVNTASELMFDGASGPTPIPLPSDWDVGTGLTEPLAFDGKHVFGGFGGGIAMYDVAGESWSQIAIAPNQFNVVIGATAERAAVLSTKDETTNDYYLVDTTSSTATFVATIGSGDWREATFDGESLFLNSPVGTGVTRVRSDGSTSTFLAPSPHAIAVDDTYLYASIDNRIVAYRTSDSTTTDVGRIDSPGYSFTILLTDDAYVYGFATALDGQEGTIFRFAKPAK